MNYVPTLEEIRRAPKVLLHDHLDGGLRAETISELARQAGYHALPAEEPGELRRWFGAAADSGSLEQYLETFGHTVAVMQTNDALVRVAAECAQDLADDGVVYAEVRFAPELHTEEGLSLEQVVEAVLEGLAAGSRDPAGTPRIRVGLLLTAIRHAARSMEIAELAVRYRDAGVAGFDIAGPEAGNPPTRHLDAFEYLQRENAHFTIHAGEGFGLPSIWQAIQWCGADRLGHGVRIIDDIATGADGSPPKLGRLAAYVRDKRIPLEMCPTSNVQTGAAASLAQHPIGLLRRLYFRVTVNTDNRLMSAPTLSGELAAVAAEFGYGWDDLQWFTVNAMKSAFLPFDERLELINGVIKPGFDQLKWRGARPLG
jgi:adenosine deaminase